MLAEIKGVRLPNLPWHDFAFDEVLDYYDGPRLLLERGLSGELYLAWWNDADADTDRWVCLPVSRPRLQAVLSGQMAARAALQRPEDGYLLVVDFDLNTGSVAGVVRTTADAIPPDSLPQPGACLKMPLPQSVSGLPVAADTLAASAILSEGVIPSDGVITGVVV